MTIQPEKKIEVDADHGIKQTAKWNGTETPDKTTKPVDGITKTPDKITKSVDGITNGHVSDTNGLESASLKYKGEQSTEEQQMGTRTVGEETKSNIKSLENGVNGVTGHDQVSDDQFQRLPKPQQDILLLHGPGQRYRLEKAHDIPELKSIHEILVQVHEEYSQQTAFLLISVGGRHWLEPRRLERPVGIISVFMSGPI